LDKVSKAFRRRNLLTQYTTLKSYLLRLGRENFFSSETKEVIRDLDLAVPKGITLGIIGRNGSGKTTLLKLISGILMPDRGSVEVNGRVSALLELGIGFHPLFSGRENIYLNGTILGLSRKEIRERYQEIVRFAELEDYIDYPVRTYSSGMYMRLAFSIATHLDPDILLIDEILAVGDEYFIKKCYDRLADFQRQNKTIIIVSHDLATIERLCEEVIWLDNGCLKERGHPRRVIDSYRQQILALHEDSLKKHQVTTPPAASPPPTEEGPDQLRNRLYRWGSMEVEIVGVRFLDQDNQERFVYCQGEPMTIELSYRVNRPIQEPVFGFAIYTTDGIRCYGTNTMIEGIDIPHLYRDGQIKILLKALELIEGTYQVDVAVHGRDGYPYDYQARLYSFMVKSDRRDLGIYRMPHQWVISP